MSSDVKVYGNVTQTARRSFADGEAGVELTPYGGQLIAAPMPELAELVRMGGSYHTLSAVAAALTAVPTTTAGLSLWNGEADGGKVYAIDSFGCTEVVTDATQQNSLSLFAMVTKGKFIAPTDAALAIGSNSGRPTYGGVCRTVAGATVVAADVWTPHGPSTPGATAFAGAVWRTTETTLRPGQYLVRPGGLFSIAVAKTVATASQVRYFIRWHEVQIRIVD